MGVFTQMPTPDGDLSSSIQAWLFGLPSWSSQATEIRQMTATLGSIRAWRKRRI
jgi:hypothetical protein